MELPRLFMTHYTHLCIYPNRAHHTYVTLHTPTCSNNHTAATHATPSYTKGGNHSTLWSSCTLHLHAHTPPHTPKSEITFPLPRHYSTCHPPTTHSQNAPQCTISHPQVCLAGAGEVVMCWGHCGRAEKRGAAAQRSGTQCSMVRLHH